MIGVRWACDQHARVRALVDSDGGFFSDRHWHDLANTMRIAGDGERLMAAYTRDGLSHALRSLSSGNTEAAVTEYWKAFADDVRRHAQLELYRSGDFDKLSAYEGALARLGVPALIIWGGRIASRPRRWPIASTPRSPAGSTFAAARLGGSKCGLGALYFGLGRRRHTRNPKTQKPLSGP
jgi:pimeloyl-ACP methyl ester carboxylesterase